MRPVCFFGPVLADCSRNSAAAALKGDDKDTADGKKGGEEEEKEKKQINKMKEQSKAAEL